MTLEDKKIEIYKNLLLGISGVKEAKYLKTVGVFCYNILGGQLGSRLSLETFCKI